MLAACGNPAGDAQTGAEVFTKVCTPCHGPTGKPDATMVAKLGVHDLTSPEFRAKVTEDKVEYQIRNGSQNKLMPSFVGAISDAQIQAVAGYVASDAFLDRK
jgi:mono/diheme cytochrome c family protein